MTITGGMHVGRVLGGRPCTCIMSLAPLGENSLRTSTS